MIQLTKVAAKTAIELVPEMGLNPEALELLDANKPPAQALEDMMEKGLFQDASKLLARALPKREAVWWAFQCAEKVSGELPAPKIRGALSAAEKWVLSPTDANRRPAMDAGDLAGVGTPAGAAAMAAYFSGGSLAPPGQAVVAPADHLTATMAAIAVILASVKDPATAEASFRAFLAKGVELGNGQNRWKEPPPKETPGDPAKEPPGRPARR